MKSPDESLLASWVKAEQDGREYEADSLFRGVMAGVPRLSPGPGFAARVLLASGIRPVKAAPGVWAAWWMYPLVGASLTLAALAVASLSGLGLLGFSLDVIHFVAFAAGRVWTLTATWATAGWSMWRVLAQVGGAVTSVLFVPAAGAFVVVNLVLASVSLLALRRLLVPQEG